MIAGHLMERVMRAQANADRVPSQAYGIEPAGTGVSLFFADGNLCRRESEALAVVLRLHDLPAVDPARSRFAAGSTSGSGPPRRPPSKDRRGCPRPASPAKPRDPPERARAWPARKKPCSLRFCPYIRRLESPSAGAPAGPTAVKRRLAIDEPLSPIPVVEARETGQTAEGETC